MNLKSEDFLQLELKMDFKQFIARFQTPSLFYRKLFKSNSSVGGRKNRDFFTKYFSGGYYTFFRSPKEITIIFFLRIKRQISPSVISSLKVRILKLYSIVKIEIGNPSEEHQNWMVKEEMNAILQPIGQDYFHHSRGLNQL
jgi:hypothetical protein